MNMLLRMLLFNEIENEQEDKLVKAYLERYLRIITALRCKGVCLNGSKPIFGITSHLMRMERWMASERMLLMK